MPSLKVDSKRSTKHWSRFHVLVFCVQNPTLTLEELLKMLVAEDMRYIMEKYIKPVYLVIERCPFIRI